MSDSIKCAMVPVGGAPCPIVVERDGLAARVAELEVQVKAAMQDYARLMLEKAKSVEQRAALAAALEKMLASAVPHPVEHPTMTEAWKVARAALAALKEPGGMSQPRKYRKIPVVVEAMELLPGTKDRVFHWITCTRYADFDPTNGSPVIVIQTLEGDMVARMGDWVIRGTKGEFYPCKPDIFRTIYEAVEE